MNRHLLLSTKSRSSPFKKNKQAQALIEYVLLLTFSAAIAIGLFGTFNSAIRTGIKKFNAVLESELRSGEYPEQISQWEN